MRANGHEKLNLFKSIKMYITSTFLISFVLVYVRVVVNLNYTIKFH